MILQRTHTDTSYRYGLTERVLSMLSTERCTCHVKNSVGILLRSLPIHKPLGMLAQWISIILTIKCTSDKRMCNFLVFPCHTLCYYQPHLWMRLQFMLFLCKIHLTDQSSVTEAFNLMIIELQSGRGHWFLKCFSQFCIPISKFSCNNILNVAQKQDCVYIPICLCYGCQF